MAEGQILTTTQELVRKALVDEHGDFLRDAVAMVAAQLMEAEISAQIGAERGEVAPAARVTHRNGYRPRAWETRVGEIELAIPRKRSGEAYFPGFLEPRRRSERALVAVVAEAYVKGVSTRKVEALVQSLGIAGMSKSEVSRLCASLGEVVRAFRERRLDADYPYVWLDARYEHVRVDGRVVSQGVLVVAGGREDGRREILAVEVADTESEATYQDLFRSLKGRGLRGVVLATSDDHAGLRAAIGRHFQGASWQRCQVHFARNLQGLVGAKHRGASPPTCGGCSRRATRPRSPPPQPRCGGWRDRWHRWTSSRPWSRCAGPALASSSGGSRWPEPAAARRSAPSRTGAVRARLSETLTPRSSSSGSPRPRTARTAPAGCSPGTPRETCCTRRCTAPGSRRCPRRSPRETDRC